MGTKTLLPDELIHKIIMYSVPDYPFLNELKTTRFIRGGCDCEGCEWKHHLGCYHYKDFNYRGKPTEQILILKVT